MSLADRQQVEELLNGMRRGGDAAARVDSARRLFALLNYSATREPLWVELAGDVKKEVAEGPGVMATGAGDDGFLVIHTRLKGAGLSRTVERGVVTALLKDHPYALFVFSNEDCSRWHLLNVKVARREESEENKDTKLRRLFRRISVSADDQIRTAVERVERLDVGRLEEGAGAVSALMVQGAHDEAFDVEAVTKEFFREYKRVFDYVEDAITGIRGPDKRRLYTQRLFNRLMFIAFIQKKGWLKFAGMEENDYLGALWADYQGRKKEDANFYSDRLTHLFFRGLNNAAHVDMLASNRGHSTPASFLQRTIGDVPYLNGGLFEKSEDGTDEADAGIVVPDKAVKAILGELFARFNFTVTESTPLDVEVAVDPEMLGKVFEELVTGRHETGSYYTPKPIVSFMCREALKVHLENKSQSEPAEAIAAFVDEHDASRLNDGEAVLEALRRVRCCDPACGSGAYLLGMMHELLDLRGSLFAATKKLDAIRAYERKLEIIQTNVYGVDMDPFAVNIARLRLWLSLAVEFEGDVPPPLPNLDFKIEAGDSLAAPDPSDSGQLQLQKTLVDELQRLKQAYLMSHGQEKKELKRAIENKREHIKAWAHGAGALPQNAFDWQVDFAEVFLSGGFDIVLANPPYVRMELIKPAKPLLRKNYPNVHAERADLYVYFYARAVELLSPGGVLSFISSNKWTRAGYGEPLRKMMAKECPLRILIDFGELPVFETASTFPCVVVGAKVATRDPLRFVRVSNLDPPYPDILVLTKVAGYDVERSNVDSDQWKLSDPAATGVIESMSKHSIPLGEYCNDEIYWGVKTGLNKAFVIDDATRRAIIKASPGAKKVIKEWVIGDNVRRWHVEPDERWLLYMHHEIDTAGLDAVLQHLKPFKERLESRATRQEWYELQQPQYRFKSALEGPKIIFPDIAKEPRFTIDRGARYVANTVYFIPRDDLYLLGVLNSSSMWRFCKERLTVIGDPEEGGRLRFFTQFVKHLPIPRASERVRSEIAEMVDKCLTADGANCQKWETEIDGLVAGLYGLSSKGR